MSERNPTATAGLSYDEQAAMMAERLMGPDGVMVKSEGGAGGMPMGRKAAEGGFVADAGGTLIDAGQKGSTTEKSQKVGRAMTSEPGRDKGTQYTGTAITDEPGHEEASGGSDGNLDTNADETTRRRKSGQVGVGGGLKAKQNVSESGDGSTRARKPGRVGFGKSDDADEDDKDEGDDKPGLKKGARIAPDAAIKSDDADEDDEDEGDEEEREEKSMIEADDLLKSLETLEAIAEGQSLPAERDRRAELAERFAAGTLSKADLAELHDLTKSEPEGALEEEEPVEQFEKSYQDSFAADPTLSAGYDVSPFLERQSQLLAASLDDMSAKLAKSITGGQENVRTFNRALAKSLRGMAELTRGQSELIKSLTERLEVVENQPMPRRGHSSVRTLSKSMPGEVSGQDGQQISQNQIFDALESMAKSMDYAPCGIKLTDATALLESSGAIPASLMRDVREHINTRGHGVR